MNMKRKVMDYLNNHPDATNLELRTIFPEINKKSLWNYSGQWKKQQGIKEAGKSESIRKRVFDFFDENPQASLSELKQAFPRANSVSISNYRYQWKKQQNNLIDKTSIKQRVFEYLSENPTASFAELKRALPEINPSSVSAYHSLWKKNKKNNVQATMMTTENVHDNPKASHLEDDQELVSALRATIEAQKVTIEAMKTQNSLLKEKQSAVLAELEGLDDLQLDEVKRIMNTYIKGMRKL